MLWKTVILCTSVLTFKRESDNSEPVAFLQTGFLLVLFREKLNQRGVLIFYNESINGTLVLVIWGSGTKI